VVTSYPNIRNLPPPPFLKDKSVAELVREALVRSGISGCNLDCVVQAFPSIDELFRAPAPDVYRVLFRAIGDADAADLALRMLLRLLVFPDIDRVLEEAVLKCYETIRRFPSSLDDLLIGSNPGDVLDPFLLQFNVELLADDQIDQALYNLVVHRCLMQLEDLVGNLHQIVLGQAAGKVRVPEPRGKTKEDYHPELNPYPGIDIRLEDAELYQLKNKTGSAKGGDGVRLGRQLRALKEHYPDSRRYYAAVLGNTLRGHRSMTAVLRADPEAEVLAGLATLQQIGAHRETPTVLLDLYAEAISEAARRASFDLKDVALKVQAEWHRRFGSGDQSGQLERLLKMAILGPNPDELSSRTFRRNRRAKQRT